MQLKAIIVDYPLRMLVHSVAHTILWARWQHIDWDYKLNQSLGLVYQLQMDRNFRAKGSVRR